MILALLLSPLIGFFINAFRFKSPNKKLSGIIGVSSCVVSFTICLLYAFIFGFEEHKLYLMPWLQVGNLDLALSFTIDALSLLMLFLITGVASLIHIYSLAYMSEDSGFTRYFTYLNLFVFMMLLLILANNLPLLFIGWEGVGLCSYLLIGFWFKEEKKVQAGMTAFVVNRIGDACFLLGIFLIFSHFGTLDFSELNQFLVGESPVRGLFNPGALGALLLLLGATGKSAQFPLYFWLPEAMAGPTPVSALIHAATMVTAGVYLIVRLFAFYSHFPDVLSLIAWIGAFTAFVAALIATRQWDFKKILAYSTISQLAYLFIALGVGAFSTSIFHLLTHGFFKALLFLCAGSVIHALDGEQDIRFMGGLKKHLPLTSWTYFIGAMALMALPPFSGFFSKDEILWSLFSSGHYALYSIALCTGFLTCFYMTRLSILVFFGKTRFKNKPHESPFVMTLPLIVLAILTSLSGFLGIPHVLSELFPGHFPHILHKLLADFSPLSFKGSLLTEGLLMLLSTLGSLGVVLFTSFYYLKNLNSKDSGWKKLLEEAFFVQKTLKNVIQVSFSRFSSHLFQQIETNFFLGSVLFLNKQIFQLRSQFSYLQNGSLSSYAFYFVIGLSFLIFLVFLR